MTRMHFAFIARSMAGSVNVRNGSKADVSVARTATSAQEGEIQLRTGLGLWPVFRLRDFALGG